MSKRTVLVVVLLMEMQLLRMLDVCQAQESGGLRFPNIFGRPNGNNPFSLSNLFRNQRPNRGPPPLGVDSADFTRGLAPPAGVGVPVLANGLQPFASGQLSPGAFLQAPPPAFQQVPHQQHVLQQPQPQLVQAAPISPAGGQFLIQQPFHPHQPQIQPQPILATPGVPISQPLATAPGFIPLDNTVAPGAQPPAASAPESAPLFPAAPPVAVAPQQAPQPAQFALSSNIIQHAVPFNSIPAQEPIKSPVSVNSQSRDINLGCAAGNDLGFCTMSDRYPRSIVEDMMHRPGCHQTVRLMYAEVPEDYTALGEGSVQSILNATKGKGAAPWSWATYKKESACDSELRFIQPGSAQDRFGNWKIVVQTGEFPQRVAIDVCRHVDDVCKVFTDCGRKSRCVQRYSYQPLISFDPLQPNQCPSMSVFRFPTSCVCHVEIDRPSPLAKSDARVSKTSG